MAEALVSVILEQLASLAHQQIGERIKLVTGVDQEIQQLARNFRAIQGLLDDAETKQVKNSAVRDWLEDLKNTSYDINDVLDEWYIEAQKLLVEKADDASKPLTGKVCHFISFPCLFCTKVVKRHDIGIRIADLNRTLDDIVKTGDRFNFKFREEPRELEREKTTSIVDVSEIYGRDIEKDKLLSLLVSERRNESTNFRVISIMGMGGIGKTTLAQLVFNDGLVDTHFNDKIWICVSDPFDEIRIAKGIIESLTGFAPNLNEYDSLLRKIKEFVDGKKFLLVLDDVWVESSSKIEKLKNSLKSGSPGSAILVTTRKESVADAVGTTDRFLIGMLPFEKCWSLFSRVSLLENASPEEYESLEVIGRKIVMKCKGLPLVVKVLGGILRFKRKTEEWQRVLESETWELEEVEQGIFPILLLSYYDLPSAVRKCFSYCAIFPKDYEMKKEELIKLWMAQDYLGVDQTKDLEVIGERYFESLATRSFFQDFQRSKDDKSITSCRIHDIVHDFALFLTNNECVSLQVSPHEIFQAVGNFRHAMVLAKPKGSSIFSNISKEVKLRSLLVDDYGGRFGKHVVLSFDKSTSLRTLNLSVRYPKIIFSKDLKNLIHLRYLSLEHSNIVKLPEVVCELWNLQTLNVSRCMMLEGLPYRIGKLSKLRHLMNSNTKLLHYMPKGIERLTSLRTLDEVRVGGPKNVCTFECLKNLNNLGGSLTIIGDSDNFGEVTDAQLQNKKNLVTLRLEFERGHEVWDFRYSQLPTNLEKLWMVHFQDSATSLKWISLNKLKMLSLRKWINCEVLPPLGKLPSLESLYLGEFPGFKRIGREFLGIQTSSSSSSVIVFPKLESFVLNDMLSLAAWEEVEEDSNDNIQIMPCLHTLEIVGCSQLNKLPKYLLLLKTLKKVKLGSLTLQKRYKKSFHSGFV